MAIPMAVVLGLACTFYVFVAIQWRREALLIRRENKRASSAIGAGFVGTVAYDAVSESRKLQTYPVGNTAGQAVSVKRDVSVMGQPKTRRHDKQVVA